VQFWPDINIIIIIIIIIIIDNEWLQQKLISLEQLIKQRQHGEGS